MATIQDLGKVAYFNKGVYNSETSYEINDVVSYNGSSYVSLGNNNQGNLPTNATYWSVVALKGEKGDTGKPFVIEKTYGTIEDMVADYDNMNIKDYVMIQGNIEDEENATLWTKTETEAPTYKWVYLADFSGASGITGQTPNIQIGTVTEGNEPSVTRRAGSSNENPILDFVLKTGATGATGATGNGISNVSKTGTSDLTDTYTITYTNGNSTTFDVSNGKGIVSIAKTGTSGLVDTYTITYNDGTTSTYTVTNGEDGEVTQAQLDETNSEVELLKKIYNAFPTTSGEDEIVTLNGTAEVNFKNIDLKGNTSQETTTGKNKYGITSYSGRTYASGLPAGTTTKIVVDNYDLNNITFHSIDTSSYIQVLFPTFQLEPNTSYTITYTRTNTISTGSNARRFIYSVDGEDNYAIIHYLTSDDEGNMTYTFTTTETGKVAIAFGFYNIASGDSSTINNLMLRLSTESNTYEPYTYGASPNPDYPQEVKVVTGNNTIKVEGKNLFDKDNANIEQGGWISFNGAKGNGNDNKLFKLAIKPSTTYTIQKIAGNRFRAGTYQNDNIANGTTFNVFRQNDSGTSITITSTAIDTYLYVQYLAGDTNEQQLLDSIQIEENSSATTYTPYTSQSYPLNLGSIELCKISTYQDYIYKDNGKWYIEKNIGKETDDGSSDETWGSLSREINGCYGFRHNGLYSEILLCDKLTNYTAVQLYNGIGEGIGFSLSGNYLAVYIKSERVNSYDATALRTFLTNNPITYYYQLSTPTSTEITDTTLIGQLNDLERAYSYDEQTNISQINANKSFIINAEAILSLKDILNS